MAAEATSCLPAADVTFSDLLFNALLCALAALCAFHAPRKDLAAARVCVGLIVADWLLYVMSWSSFSLHAGLVQLGLDIASRDLWSIMDAMVGAGVILRAYDRPWGRLLWVLLAAQVALHGLSEVGVISIDSYFEWLDRLFWGQIAVFVTLGGGGVWQRVGDLGAELATWGRMARGAVAATCAARTGTARTRGPRG